MAKQIKSYVVRSLDIGEADYIFVVDYTINDSVIPDLKKQAGIDVSIASTKTLAEAKADIEAAIKVEEGIT